jgi:hypothetical protein
LERGVGWLKILVSAVSCGVAVWTSIDYKSYGIGELASPAFILGCVAVSLSKQELKLPGLKLFGRPD